MTVSNALPREKAVQSLQGQTVTLRYEGCTEFRYASAKYTFDFSEHEWRREMVHFYGATDSGLIPADIAERFYEKVWPVASLPEKLYCTDTARLVPGNAKERRLFQGEIKYLSKFRAQIFGKMFCWVIEADTDEPYSTLASAFQALLAELDI